VGGDWYVHLQDRVQGPFDLDELISAAADGRIFKQTLVRRGIDGPWVTAEHVDGLAFGTRPVLPRAQVEPVSFVAEPEFVPIVRPRRRRSSPLLLWNLVLMIGTLVAAVVILQKRDPALLQRMLTILGKPQPIVAANPVPVVPQPPVNPRPVGVAGVPARAPVQNVVRIQPPAVEGQVAGPIPHLPAFVRGPRPPAPKLPAKDAETRALDAEAGRALTAKEAVAHFDDFAARHTLTVAQKTAFDAARKPWDDRAKQNLMRLGAKWVPAAEVILAQKIADNQVRTAHEMLKVLDFIGARKALERAISTDANSIVAAYTLGLLCSIASPDKRSPQYAEKYFKIALHREPGDVPTLNNLALAEIRLRKYSDALRYLKEAAEKSPNFEEITQNLGRLVSEARRGNLHLSATVLTQASDIYAKVVALNQGRPASTRTGWLYIPLKGQPRVPVVVTSARSPGADIYEDHCCSVCNGRTRVRCPHCSHGSKLADEAHVVTTPTPFGDFTTVQPTIVQRQCTVCGGTGYIRCPHCSNGYDQGAP
jgi:tetratricopeptide (TPR) repeat protein